MDSFKGLFAGELANMPTLVRHFRKVGNLKVSKLSVWATNLFESVSLPIFSEKTGPTRWFWVWNLHVPLCKGYGASIPTIFMGEHRFWKWQNRVQMPLGTHPRVVRLSSNSQDLKYTPVPQLDQVWAKMIHFPWRNLEFSILPTICVLDFSGLPKENRFG